MTMPEQPYTWNQANHPLSGQLGSLAAAKYNETLQETTQRPSLSELPGVRDYDTQAGVVFYEDGTQSSVKTAFARYAAQQGFQERL